MSGGSCVRVGGGLLVLMALAATLVGCCRTRCGCGRAKVLQTGITPEAGVLPEPTVKAHDVGELLGLLASPALATSDLTTFGLARPAGAEPGSPREVLIARLRERLPPDLVTDLVLEPGSRTLLATGGLLAQHLLQDELMALHQHALYLALEAARTDEP